MNTLGQLIGVLFVVGLIIRYFWWIALVVAAWFGYRWGRVAWARHCAAADAWAVEQKAIAARADQQHAWVMAGEDRGVYGEVGRVLNATPSR
ncbi:MAG: hypothetical protein QOF66_1334, partial [Mycobacterium sp.]|uniref:hypothetical protein n=1 Tax=Mycobacterium sp. TaxID=1785 RepID=UPI0028B26E54|nr:hypothetical protein [Mycobacterium sp.]